MSRRLVNALLRAALQREKAEAFLHADYQPGRAISWDDGPGRALYGTVVLLGNGRAKVRNRLTGKEYWISMERIRP